MMLGNQQEDIRQHIRKTAVVLLGILVVLLIYVSYIQVVKSEYYTAHPLNRRTRDLAQKKQYGDLLDRNGKRLAYSERNDQGNYTRIYPYSAITAHIIGYNSTKYGSSGIESLYSANLSGTANSINHLGAVSQLWAGTKGNSLVLTLDANLQKIAYQALKGRRGAIVAVVPATGEILALVSSPSFDPELIDEEWSRVSASSESPLLNRSIQGLYPPGSTMKVAIAEAVLAEKIVSPTKKYTCSGTLQIGPDYVLSESKAKAHGNLDLKQALAVSCNITFGSLSLELGRDRMAKMFKRYGFDQQSPLALQENTGRLPNFAILGDGDLAQTGIGQGSLLVSPLQMAMLASCFANKGIIMKPYLVHAIRNSAGSVISEATPEVWLKPTTAELADKVADMMIAVVNEGTGSAAQISGIRVAGKTGTAENPHGADHAWFIGFAPANQPEIAVAVIVENAGSGGTVAAPIARELFIQALR